MFEILKKRKLQENVAEYVVKAPDVVRHCRPGQFIILRVDKDGERVPFTICDYDKDAGTVTILVQTVGYTTMKLSEVPEGGTIEDFVGPLGNPTDLTDAKSVCLVGGGIGSAVIYPQAKLLKKEGVSVDVILGARDESLLMYETEFEENSDRLHIVTDNGSKGEKGFVTDKLKQLLDAGAEFDVVFAVGPMLMMKAVAELTRGYGVKTIVSLNSIMVDGTGMCGCCRVTVGGKTKYACVDGPEFDGHEVDFDEAWNRLGIYREYEREHVCRLRGARHE